VGARPIASAPDCRPTPVFVRRGSGEAGGQLRSSFARRALLTPPRESLPRIGCLFPNDASRGLFTIPAEIFYGKLENFLPPGRLAASAQWGVQLRIKRNEREKTKHETRVMSKHEVHVELCGQESYLWVFGSIGQGCLAIDLASHWHFVRIALPSSTAGRQRGGAKPEQFGVKFVKTALDAGRTTGKVLGDPPGTPATFLLNLSVGPYRGVALIQLGARNAGAPVISITCIEPWAGGGYNGPARDRWTHASNYTMRLERPWALRDVRQEKERPRPCSRMAPNPGLGLATWSSKPLLKHRQGHGRRRGETPRQPRGLGQACPDPRYQGHAHRRNATLRSRMCRKGGERVSSIPWSVDGLRQRGSPTPPKLGLGHAMKKHFPGRRRTAQGRPSGCAIYLSSPRRRAPGFRTWNSAGRGISTDS